MSKPQLAIVSDIFGLSDGNWMKQYESRLSHHFTVFQFDSRELAGIQHLDQREVHSAFVGGGIDAAVQKLISLENQFDVVIGFSVGGTIAWKYALEKSNMRLYLISATRLRNEVERPSSEVELYFGDFEQNGPSEKWFARLQVHPVIIEGEDHHCYKATSVVQMVCGRILDAAQQSK